MSEPSIKKKTDISLLRIIATLGVVFLHTNNTLTANPKMFSLSEQQFKFYTALWSLMQWAVPIFMMITGALMLNRKKTYSWREVLFKYVKRIIFALFLFGVPFSWLEIVMNEKKVSISLLIRGVVNVINGESWGHLWYLYILIGFYLTLPIIKAFVDQVDTENYRYILILLFVFKFVFPIVNMVGVDISFRIPIIEDIIFYSLLGAYICRYNCLNRMKLWSKSIVVLVCVLVKICASYKLDCNGEISSFMTPLMAVMIFTSIRGTCVSNKLDGWLWKLDRLCFGVYLIHPILTNGFYKVLKLHPAMFGANVFVVLVFWIWFCLISFCGSWILYQIKPLKKYVL